MDVHVAQDLLFASYLRVHDYKEKADIIFARLGIPEVTPGMLQEAVAVIATIPGYCDYTSYSPRAYPQYNRNIITLFWESLRLNPGYREDYRTSSEDVQFFQDKYRILTPLSPDEPLSDVTLGLLNRAALDTVGVTHKWLPLIPQNELVEETKRIHEQYLPDPELEVRPVVNFPESFRALKALRLAQEGRTVGEIIKAIDYPPVKVDENNYDDENRKEKAEYDLEKGAGLVNFAGYGLKEFLLGDVQPRPMNVALKKILTGFKLRARSLNAKGYPIYEEPCPLDDPLP